MLTATNVDTIPTIVPKINSTILCLPKLILDQYTTGINRKSHSIFPPIILTNIVIGPDTPQACPLALIFNTLFTKDRNTPDSRYAINIFLTIIGAPNKKVKSVPST